MVSEELLHTAFVCPANPLPVHRDPLLLHLVPSVMMGALCIAAVCADV